MSKKLSQAKLAILYKVNQDWISKAKARGIDIHDKEAIRAAILSQSKRPPAWSNGCWWDEKPEDDPIISEDLTSKETEDQIKALEKQALAATDYDGSRFIRTKIQSLKELLQLQILAGDYVHKDDVVADITRIGFGAGALLEQLTSDLPAMLEGLTAAQMKVKIREASRRIRLALADETNKLFK